MLIVNRQPIPVDFSTSNALYTFTLPCQQVPVDRAVGIESAWGLEENVRAVESVRAVEIVECVRSIMTVRTVRDERTVLIYSTGYTVSKVSHDLVGMMMLDRADRYLEVRIERTEKAELNAVYVLSVSTVSIAMRGKERC